MHATRPPLTAAARRARLGAATALLCAVIAATASPAAAQTSGDTTSTTAAPSRNADSVDAGDAGREQDPAAAVSTTTAPKAGGSPDGSALEGLLPALAPITDAATMDDLRGRYGSLSAALVVMYASQTGTPLDEFVAANADSLAAALGADRPAAAALGVGRPVDAQALTLALATNGIAADLRAAGSVDSYTRALSENAASLDARVVAAGATWAQQLSQLRTPAVSTPAMPSLGSGGPEALAVGLFANRAATAMVTDFPDLFSQVRSSGVGTAQSAAAWRTSMRNAMAATEADFSTALPNPCYGALMTAMASGDSSAARARAGSGCGSCVSTGLYLNGQMSRLFDPKVSTTQSNPFDNLLPPAEFNQLQPWQRQAIGSGGGQLGQNLSSALTGSGGCGGSAAARGAASTILPGVFSQLSRR